MGDTFTDESDVGFLLGDVSCLSPYPLVRMFPLHVSSIRLSSSDESVPAKDQPCPHLVPPQLSTFCERCHSERRTLVARHSSFLNQTVIEALAVRNDSDWQVLFRQSIRRHHTPVDHFAEHGTSVLCRAARRTTCTSLSTKCRRQGSFV